MIQIEEVIGVYIEVQMRQYVIMAVPQIKGGYFGLQILVREDSSRIRNRSGFFGNRQDMRGNKTLKTKDVAINMVYQGGIRFVTGREGGITRTIRSGLWDHRGGNV